MVRLIHKKWLVYVGYDDCEIKKRKKEEERGERRRKEKEFVKTKNKFGAYYQT